MGDLQRLFELCPPPGVADPSTPETEDGSLLVPSSHLKLNDAYGAGCFDEFLWVFGKDQENPNLDIAARTRSCRSILGTKVLPSMREWLNEFGITIDSLVQWGGTDNGDSLLWIPAGDPENWPTVIVEAGQLRFSTTSRSSTGVIVDLLESRLMIDFFPEDFPSDQPDFSKDPYSGG